MVRVIAGRAGGLLLKVPKGERTRPTADRVKESLFAILGEHVVDAEVLDLFAGSGALGIEALSRGAAHATFVESDPHTAQLIRENLAFTRLSQQARVYVGDVRRILPRLAVPPGGFTLLFCDPPYNRGWLAQTVRALQTADVLAEGALAVFEHHAKEEMPPPTEKAMDHDSPLRLVRQERYGETRISFVRWSTRRSS